MSQANSIGQSNKQKKSNKVLKIKCYKYTFRSEYKEEIFPMDILLAMKEAIL